MALIKDVEIGDVLHVEVNAQHVTFAVLKKTGRKARLLIDSTEKFKVELEKHDFINEDRAVSVG